MRLHPSPREPRPDALLAGLCLATAMTAGACGKAGKSDPDAGAVADPPACVGEGYVVLEGSTLAEVDARTKAHADMLSAVDVAEIDLAKASAQFGIIEGLYRSAGLDAAVKARRDVRLSGAPVVGGELDAAITSAIADGKKASTQLQVIVAGQRLDTALLRFFALSVLEGISQGSPRAFDEGFGYLGAKQDNLETHRVALARFATEVDADTQTSFALVLFGVMKDGECQLMKGLAAEHATEEKELAKLPGYPSIVAKMTERTTALFATAAARLAIGMKGKEADSARVDLTRLEGLFGFLSPVLTGEKQAAADTLRAELKKADDAIAAGKADWNASFRHADVKQLLTTAFHLTVAD